MRLQDVLFCDDIRQELNNKVSLMGLHNDRIILNINEIKNIVWPQPINLSVLLRFRLNEEEEMPTSFEFEYLLNTKSLIKINGELNISFNDKNHFQLILNGTGLPLEPGNLGFSIKIYSKTKLLFSEKNESALVISIN